MSNKVKPTKRFKKHAVAATLSATMALFASPMFAQQAFADLPVNLMASQTSLAPLVDQVTPAVVNVSVKATISQGGNSPLFEDEFFRRFFELPDGGQAPREQEAQSVGSGVIVDAEKGYVLTNNHVIEDADEIVIKLKDGREIEAELIGTDEGTDIAVLQIEAENLVELPIGNAESARVGDFVLAVGNPFGIGQTVTSGIISAVGRTGLNIEGYENFIQTDASINPGNSGGALVAMDGTLIGINTAIIAPARGNVGIGFAVPADMAHSVMNQLIEFGEVKRGQIGVVIQDLTPELAEALALETTKGALISQVVEGSPAELAGIESGDVVIEANGREVKNLSDLRNQVGLVRLGEEIDVKFIRDGEEKTATLKVDTVSAFAAQNGEIDQLAGVKLSAGADKGVVIDSIEPGTEAEAYGLEVGDIILEVNKQAVNTLSELAEGFSSDSSVYALLIERQGKRVYVIIR